MGDDRRSYQQTWDVALGLLSRREHSKQELEAKLLSRKAPPDIVRQVLVDLKQSGYLSDQRFTEVFVRSRMARGHGPLKIRQELSARGIKEDVIEQHMDHSEQTWESILYQVWAKKYGAVMPSSYQQWAKQARFLQSRGFTSEQIRKVVAWQEQV